MKRPLSVLLVLCLLLSVFHYAAPVRAIIPGEDAFQLDADCQILNYIDSEVFSQGNHVARLKDEETLSSYVFLNQDGTETVYYMDEEVKYRDASGTVQEKDVSLTAATNGFTTARNDVQVFMPSTLSTGVAMSYGGYDVTLVPQNLSLNASAQRSDGTIVYPNCFGYGTALVYTPTLSGLKEDIFLAMYTGVSSFTFLLNTDGLNVYRGEFDRYYLAEFADSEVKIQMQDIVAYDATGDHCLGEMTVTPITEGQQYRLTVSIDPDFLTDENTVYPVMIDPSLTVSDNTHGAGAIEDATVYSGKPTLNTGSWSYTRAGYDDDTYQIGRTVVKLSGLFSDSSYLAATADQITSVVYYAKEATGSAAAGVTLHALNSNSTWTETSVTWNNVGTFDSTATATASLTNGQYAAFDIISLVKAWKNGSYSSGSCGFIIKGDNETTIDKAMYSCEYSNTERRPYVVITYTAELSLNYYSLALEVGETRQITAYTLPTGQSVTWVSSNSAVASVSTSGLVTANKVGSAAITVTSEEGTVATCNVYVVIPDGIYSISNSAVTSGGVAGQLTVPMDDVVSGTATTIEKVNTSFPEHYAQLWKVTYVTGGYYSIRPVRDFTMGLRRSSDSVYMGTLGSNDAASSVASDYRWTIEATSNGYAIKSLGSSSYALKVLDSTMGSFVGTGTYSTNDSSSRWTLTQVTMSNDLVLYDQRSDEEAIAPNDTSDYETTRSVVPQATATLAEMELDHFVCSNSSTYSQTIAWTSANTSIATVNRSTGAVTGVDYGVTTITGTKTISGTTYTVSYKMVVSDLPVSGYELEYEPERWNKPDGTDTDYRGDIEANTNCYLYALNLQVNPGTNEIIDGKRSPGQFAANNQSNYSINASLMTQEQKDAFCALVEADAAVESISFLFSEVGENEVCPPGTYKVALAFATRSDYHWYRQNADGTWSHKRGSTEVTILDSGNNTIQNPRTALKTYNIDTYIHIGFYAITPVNQMYTPTEKEKEEIQTFSGGTLINFSNTKEKK